MKFLDDDNAQKDLTIYNMSHSVLYYILRKDEE